MLARGAGVGAYSGEGLGSGEGSEVSGDLLTDLDHADLALGGVAVRGGPGTVVNLR